MTRTMHPASELETEFLFELLLEGSDQIDAGQTRIAPVTGGVFSGPSISGTVASGGADWITKTAAGDTALDVRLVLVTDDEAQIYMSYTGLVHSGEDGLYWRVRPQFQTAAKKYDYLNHLVAIGKSKRVEGTIASYDIFRIL
ncbi:MAG: hypothetical protein DHS20C12_29890 [Pseudohongiella sp.]|nr:MAG: hypothetical protein DHS20C12_29890 [Pseudohongiella sp.]